MPDRRIIGAFAAIYLIWGSTYLAIATAVADVPPVFMVAVRGMMAGGALYLWIRRRGGAPIGARELVAAVPTAALLFGGGYVLVGWAEQHVPSGPAALLNATTPAWVVLFEWLTRRRDRPDWSFVVALAMGVGGVGGLVGNGEGAGIPFWPAIALVGASVAWAAGTVRTRMRAHGEPIRDAALQLITGGLLLLPVSAVLGETPRVMAGFSTHSLLALGYLILAGSLTGYSAYVWLLDRVPASKVASHSYINPLIAVLLGAGLVGEAVYRSTVVAALLILLSVFAIVRERPARPGFEIRKLAA
ncbi:MAG: EamA family transporter [Gemmatimonadota bacterium]